MVASVSRPVARTGPSSLARCWGFRDCRRHRLGPGNLAAWSSASDFRRHQRHRLPVARSAQSPPTGDRPNGRRGHRHCLRRTGFTASAGTAAAGRAFAASSPCGDLLLHAGCHLLRPGAGRADPGRGLRRARAGTGSGNRGLAPDGGCGARHRRRPPVQPSAADARSYPPHPRCHRCIAAETGRVLSRRRRRLQREGSREGGVRPQPTDCGAGEPDRTQCRHRSGAACRPMDAQGPVRRPHHYRHRQPIRSPRNPSLCPLAPLRRGARRRAPQRRAACGSEIH